MNERLTSEQIRDKKYPSFFRWSARVAQFRKDAAPYVREQPIDVPFADQSQPPRMWLPGVLTQSGLVKRAEAYERAQEILQIKGEELNG
ncbi:MAG: hypothetical protein ABIR37_00910 [Candidatus Saccharimonadales bacterium]